LGGGEDVEDELWGVIDGDRQISLIVRPYMLGRHQATTTLTSSCGAGGRLSATYLLEYPRRPSPSARGRYIHLAALPSLVSTSGWTRWGRRWDTRAKRLRRGCSRHTRPSEDTSPPVSHTTSRPPISCRTTRSRSPPLPISSSSPPPFGQPSLDGGSEPSHQDGTDLNSRGRPTYNLATLRDEWSYLFSAMVSYVALVCAQARGRGSTDRLRSTCRTSRAGGGEI